MNTIIENKIWTISNFLSNNECVKFIEQIANKTGTNPFTNSGYFKNDKYIDEDLASSFFNRIKDKIDIDIFRANNLIMTGMYVPGNRFGLHTDTGLYIDYNKKEKSRYTLLIYLNDNYEGGQTQFYSDEFQKTAAIQPEKGMALLFDIDLWHQGEEVISGQKYWIGCEIISAFS